MSPQPSVIIAGRSKDTKNYEKALERLGVFHRTVLDPETACQATHLLLPGGGDITPAFFGQKDRGSRNIDTELDILQLRLLSCFVAQKKPVLGICKGLQLINVHFGGDVIQHIDTADAHKWKDCDQFHPVWRCELSRLDFFYQLYGTSAMVNSAHHQAAGRMGDGLIPVCRAVDNVIDGLTHKALPVLAVQWHPERLPDGRGDSLFSYFLSL